MRGDAPSRHARRLRSAAVRPRSCSAGCPSSRSPARLTRRSACAPSNEDRDVDLHHHRAKQRACFERAEPLIVQRRGKDVHFEHDRAERIVGDRLAKTANPRADGEVALTQGREQVRQRLQRQHDSTPHAERAAGPDADDQRRQGPLDFRCVIAGPEEDERDEGGGKTGGERQQEDPLIEAQPGIGSGGRRVERAGERALDGLTGTRVHREILRRSTSYRP